ncbi:MAG: hypothetical protein ACW99G_20145 [Candidatus Thorarchaeota archaeon]
MECPNCGNHELINDYTDEMEPMDWCPHCGKEVTGEDIEDYDEATVPRVEGEHSGDQVPSTVGDKVRR